MFIVFIIFVNDLFGNTLVRDQFSLLTSAYSMPIINILAVY